MMKQNTVTTVWALGIDLAHKEFDAALAPAGCSPQQWRDFPARHFDLPPNSNQAARELEAWVRRQTGGQKPHWVVVESTGHLSIRTAAQLRKLKWPETFVANPHRIRSLSVSAGIRHKNDAIDAAMIALYAALQRPKPPVPKSETEQHLCELCRARDRCVQEITRWKNRLPEMLFEEDRKFILPIIAQLEKTKKEMENKIKEVVENDPVLANQRRKVQQVPGIGPVIAATLTAELGDLTQYKRTKLIAAVGLYPVHSRSGGKQVSPPKLAKGGGKQVRRVLFGGAMSLFRSRGVFREWIEEQIAKGKKKMEIMTALMRKILMIARAVMKNNGQYNETLIGKKMSMNMNMA